MEATGGTTFVVDGAAPEDELDPLGDELSGFGDWVPPAVEVAVVSADSDPLLHPASSAIIATIASTTVSGAFFRAAIIVSTALSQFSAGRNEFRATAAEPLRPGARVSRSWVRPA
ncbi:MAG: hypothetical protein ABJD68_11355 [Nakamurella sp.]